MSFLKAWRSVLLYTSRSHEFYFVIILYITSVPPQIFQVPAPMIFKRLETYFMELPLKYARGYQPYEENSNKLFQS